MIDLWLVLFNSRLHEFEIYSLGRVRDWRRKSLFLARGKDLSEIYEEWFPGSHKRVRPQRTINVDWWIRGKSRGEDVL